MIFGNIILFTFGGPFLGGSGFTMPWGGGYWHSAIEIIFSCSTAEEMKTKYFDHPAHVAAAKVIDPLVEDAWAMDWLEDRDTLVVYTWTVYSKSNGE